MFVTRRMYQFKQVDFALKSLLIQENINSEIILVQKDFYKLKIKLEKFREQIDPDRFTAMVKSIGNGHTKEKDLLLYSDPL